MQLMFDAIRQLFTRSPKSGTCTHRTWKEVRYPRFYPQYFQVELECADCGERVVRDKSDLPHGFIIKST